MSKAAWQWIITHFIANIQAILLKLLKALPIGVLAGIIAYIGIYIYEKKYKIQLETKRKISFLFFFAYITMVLDMAIFSRPLGSVCQIDLIPFDTPGGFRYIVLYGIANVVIFLPMGILLPMIWKKMNNIRWIILIGFLGSLFIELAQLLLQCGVFQTEDLIMNTVGAGVGYWIYAKSRA